MNNLQEAVYCDAWTENFHKWSFSKYSDFYDAVKDMVGGNEEFIEEIASSIAMAHYHSEDCPNIFEAYSMDEANAICYLYETSAKNKCYQEDAELMFSEYMTEKGLDSYDF